MRGLFIAILLVSCGAGLSRVEESARVAGAGYLDLHAREAARAAGVSYSGCPRDQQSVRGSGESFSVEACRARVDVHCVWGAGDWVCSAEPQLDAIRDAQEEHARDVATHAAPPPPTAAPMAVAAPPRPSSRAASFRVGPDGVLALDAIADWLDFAARASATHRGSVLISMTIRNGDSEACDHALTFTAAGEPLRFEAARRDGLVSRYVLDAATFDSLGERVPLRASVCGQTLSFGHTELRALRAFIEADRAL